MQRRGGSGQPAKGRRATRPKARKAPTVPAFTTDLQERLDQHTRERDEALEQLAATSEVLKVVSSSPGELVPVFQAMLANAVRICGATFGNLWLRDGDIFRLGATHGGPQAYTDFLVSQDVWRPDPRLWSGQMLRTRDTLQLADVAAAPTYG